MRRLTVGLDVPAGLAVLSAGLTGGSRGGAESRRLAWTGGGVGGGLRLAFATDLVRGGRLVARARVLIVTAGKHLGRAADDRCGHRDLTRQLATAGVLVEVDRPSGAPVQAAPAARRGRRIALPASVRVRCLASGQAQTRLAHPALEVACARVGPTGRPLGVIVAGVPLEDSLASLAALRRALVLGVLGGVLLAGVLSLLVARRALRPLRRIALTAEKIRSGDLSRRIAYRARDEVGEVADVLDACFAELEQAIERQRRFAADASHELKTPLAAIRANVELLRGWASLDPAARERTLGSLEQAAGRASHLVADLLQLVRLDRDTPRPHVPVRLDETVLGAAREASPLRRDVAIRFDRLADVTLDGDPIGLQQLLLNSLDNALRVSPPQNEVTVALETEDGVTRVRVTDAGPGIEPAKLQTIFDRFYSAKVGAEADGGAGLGLAIARAIAREHGGDLVACNNTGAGATLLLTLPCDPKPTTSTKPDALDQAAGGHATNRGRAFLG